MRRLTVVICLVAFLMVACGRDVEIGGKMRKTIGLVNVIVSDDSLLEVKDPTIKYEVIWGNVIWGAVLFETVIAPIYFFGFSMFQPVGLKEQKP